MGVRNFPASPLLHAGAPRGPPPLAARVPRFSVVHKAQPGRGHKLERSLLGKGEKSGICRALPRPSLSFNRINRNPMLNLGAFGLLSKVLL